MLSSSDDCLRLLFLAFISRSAFLSFLLCRALLRNRQPIINAQIAIDRTREMMTVRYVCFWTGAGFQPGGSESVISTVGWMTGSVMGDDGAGGHIWSFAALVVFLQDCGGCVSASARMCRRLTPHTVEPYRVYGSTFLQRPSEPCSYLSGSILASVGLGRLLGPAED